MTPAYDPSIRTYVWAYKSVLGKHIQPFPDSLVAVPRVLQLSQNAIYIGGEEDSEQL